MKELILKQLQDEESKYIFDNRVKFLESNGTNFKYIWNIVETTKEGKAFEEIINKTAHRMIFGAGLWGKEFLGVWDSFVEPKCWEKIVDNNYKRFSDSINGKKVESPNEITLENDVFITTRLYYDEIKSQLKRIGLDENHIINVGAVIDDMATRQYFDLKEMSPSGDEVFVDVGAFDGKTSLNFIKWANGNFKKIYCFEADKNNVKKCINSLSKKTSKYEVISKGAYSKECRLGFESKGNGGSSINESANEFIETTTIDRALCDVQATFIKMDIEGSEMEALKGCAETIMKYKPKLAISVYHKLNDIIEIPEYILSINPEYKLYLRHYSLGSYETILYAL